MAQSKTRDEQIEEQLSRIDQYDSAFLEDLYRQLRSIRAFEMRTAELSEAGEIPGPVHLCMGQEAVAVGTCRALREDDIIGSTHRGHGHVLAKGAEIKKMMAELLGKQTGLNEGRGGSMHMVDFSLGIFGCNAIVGASVPHVAGGILSSRLDGGDRVGVAFFGDGGANEGVVAETLNLAAIWDLPVLFLCENNQYAVSTSRQYAVAGERISDRATGYGIPARTINGQDVLNVYEHVREAVEDARRDNQPQFIECVTYRYSGHWSGEGALLRDRSYRSDEEIDDWRETRDPVHTYRSALTDSGRFAEEDLEALDEGIRTELDEAVEFALDSSFPPVDGVFEDAYTDQDYPNFPAQGYR